MTQQVAFNGAGLVLDCIKDALNTEEDGLNLIEIARHAHQAELKLAGIINYINGNDCTLNELLRKILKD